MPVVGLTNSIEWFTVSCWATFGKELTVLYAVHSSDHTVVPGATFCCIIGSSAAAEQSGTVQTMPKAGLIDVSIIPNTHPVWARPRWFCGGDHHMHALQVCIKRWFVNLDDNNRPSQLYWNLQEFSWAHLTKPPINANYCVMSHFSLLLHGHLFGILSHLQIQ